MSVVPYAVGGATPLVVAGARYVAREGFAGAVEGAGAGIRKRVRDALSGSHNGTSNAGQSTASATKVPRSVPRMRRLQRQMIQDCCESLFETKIKTSSFTDLRPEPTSYFALVNQLPQGTGDEGRVGNRISSRFLKVKINTSQGTSPTAMRVLVVIDRAANKTAAVHSDLFDQVIGTVSMFNRNNVGRGRRFHVLKDFSTICSNTNPIGTFDLNVPLKFRTQYTGAGATIADISAYALYVVVLGGNVATERGYLSFTYEFFYKDA